MMMLRQNLQVIGNVVVQVFHAPSFGDEDFELTTATTATPILLTPASDAGQQTFITLDHPHSAGRHDDDDKSPTSPDTGCWSSPDVSRSPSCDVDQRRCHGFQHARRPGGDDADNCLLKLPPPDELHIPDIRYAEFYRCSQQQQQSLNIPAVTYATPPPPPRYPPGYGAVMRTTASTEPCLLLDDGGLPLRCDRGAYNAPSAAEYVGPAGVGVCYNGAGVGLCDNSSSATEMLLRQDAVRVLIQLTKILD